MFAEILLYSALALSQPESAVAQLEVEATLNKCVWTESKLTLSPGDSRLERLVDGLQKQSIGSGLHDLAERQLAGRRNAPVSIVLETLVCGDDGIASGGDHEHGSDAKYVVGQIESFPGLNLPEGSTITLNYCENSTKSSVTFTRSNGNWVVTKVNSEFLTSGCPPV